MLCRAELPLLYWNVLYWTLNWIVLPSSHLCCAFLCSSLLYHTVQYCVILYFTILKLFCTLQYSLCSILLHSCIICGSILLQVQDLHCNVLHYMAVPLSCHVLPCLALSCPGLPALFYSNLLHSTAPFPTLPTIYSTQLYSFPTPIHHALLYSALFTIYPILL